MHFDKFSFAAPRIGGIGHTPLSIEEKIPQKCHRLVIGTGAYGRLPVMKEVTREAERRRVELLSY